MLPVKLQNTPPPTIGHAATSLPGELPNLGQRPNHPSNEMQEGKGEKGL